MVSLVKNKGAMIPEIQGSVLQAARLRLKLKPEELGAKACLSKKHIIQLEEGASPLFTLRLIRSPWPRKLGNFSG